MINKKLTFDKALFRGHFCAKVTGNDIGLIQQTSKIQVISK